MIITARNEIPKPIPSLAASPGGGSPVVNVSVDDAVVVVVVVVVTIAGLNEPATKIPGALALA